uniref:F-box domain-containing protein n=1 Tax=Cannabis sativa TaxID=3483 RepID=A0A803QTY5_CANSA
MAEQSSINNCGLPKKKRIKFKRTSIAKAEDRLSKLPNIILVHILSFLPTTNGVVRTCILSKRWKLIWYSLPKLSFCDTTTTVCEFQKFQNYVDNCFEHCKKGMYFIADSALISFKLQIKSFLRSKACSLDKWN